MNSSHTEQIKVIRMNQMQVEELSEESGNWKEPQATTLGKLESLRIQAARFVNDSQLAAGSLLSTRRSCGRIADESEMQNGASKEKTVEIEIS